MRRLPAFAALVAVPVAAVPPPPPAPGTLEATSATIHALTSKDLAAYEDLLAADFVGHTDDGEKTRTREAWLQEMREAFMNPAFNVTIMHVFQTGATIDGKFRQQIMLVENVDNYVLRSNGIPGDCCGFYLTETITFDGQKVMRIDRSRLYDNMLSATGARTDIK